MNQKERKIVPLKDLNLSNRFLFDQVMEDPATLQDVLSIVMGREITLFVQSETEKELRVSPLIRSIRLDVFSIDEDRTVYDTEVQSTWKPDLEKRSRYYQALLDTSLLEPGIPDYNLLNNSCLIMIMTFDLFGRKKYRYTFRKRCEEAPDCVLADGAVLIFLNTKGQNPEEIPEELADLLHYIEDTSDAAAAKTSSRRIQRIHERVKKVKSSEEIGVKYMQAWEEKYYDIQQAHSEGLAEGRSGILKELISKKIKKGKSPEEIAESLEMDSAAVRSLIAELRSEQST